MLNRPRPERPDHDNDRPTRLRTADILGPAFRRFLWNCYDHLGLLILANLLWLALLIPIVTAPAATAGLFEIARKVANREDVRVRDFFAGFRRDLFPASRVGTVTLVGGFLLWIAVDFYSHLGGRASLPGMFLAAALIWISAFVVLMHVHLHPLIATGDRSLKVLARKSGLLVLDNVGYTVGIAVQALMVTVICTLTGAGLVLILGSCLAVLLSTGHRELLKRYFPDSSEAQEPEESRRWRDVLRPWDTPKSH